MYKKKWRSSYVMAMILSAMLILFAGCSSNKEQANPEASDNLSGASDTADTGSKEFKLWIGWTTAVNNDSLVQQYWRVKEPGIKVTMESLQGDALTALNLKLNTGGFEDAAFFGRKETIKTAMIKSGTIQSLEQYFEMPDKYPNLAAIPKVYLDQMKDAEGHIWSIPVDFDQDPDNPWTGWASQGWYVRTDVLEKAGMTIEDLSTLEGIETYLRKAKMQQDSSGKPLLPLGMSLTNNNESVILSTFGVKTASGSGVVPVQKKDDGFMLWLDDPQFKAAYQWMNSMYREGLLDPEVTVDKSERYKEKNKSGRYAINATSFWNMGPSLWESLDGPTEPGWFYQVIPFPKVQGVQKIGINTIVNPFPAEDIYISKNTKNLEAILEFFDYALQQKEEMQLVITEGPPGLYWDWIDQPLGKWKFIDEKYKEARNSGNEAVQRTMSPELGGLASYGKWQPWWTLGDYEHAGFPKTAEFSQAIGQMGGVEKIHDYDMVLAKSGGLWEKYKPELDNLLDEYRAKLIMSTDDKQFEANWNDFLTAIEKRGHWSELKQEWLDEYQIMSK
ncbi:hypothetical protein [Paenibacillus sp. GCM10027626]|uniref:hypothetical protein n=1 Tax=Paenibacillus sp. GCM10027626 TaxID=3273411 RepID=UPI00362F3395